MTEAVQANETALQLGPENPQEIRQEIRECKELDSRLNLAEAVAFQMKGMYSIKAADNMMPNVPLAAVSHNFHEVISLCFKEVQA